MSPVPLAQIIFYLATLFLPPATTFTISSGYDQKITWVLRDDGAWYATTESGDAGVWSVSGLSVSVVEHGKTNKTDLSQFLKVEDVGDQTKVKLAILGGHWVSVSETNSSITLSQDKDGILSKPVVITYSIK